MTSPKPAFPAPNHDHGRCTAEGLAHAERVCAKRARKLTPIRRQVLRALLSGHRPLGAYEVIDELAKSMPRPAPITVYRALDFLMANGLVHRIESRNAFLACAHDHDATAMVAFLICERCGSVGEIPALPVAHGLSSAARATGFASKSPAPARTASGPPRRNNNTAIKPPVIGETWRHIKRYLPPGGRSVLSRLC